MKKKKKFFILFRQNHGSSNENIINSKAKAVGVLDFLIIRLNFPKVSRKINESLVHQNS